MLGSDMAEEPTSKKARNRVKTELKILYALETLLTEQGFDALGVNAVAQASGVSKELIYRYFGGLEGLVLAWVEERDYWSFRRIDLAQDRLTNSGAGAQRMIRESLHTFLEELRGNPQIQEIRRWEVHSRSPLAQRIARRREESGVRLVSRIPGEGRDVAAIYALLQAGLCYMVLRSTALESYCGVSLRTEEGWNRLEQTIDTILQAVFSGEPPKAETTAKKPKPRRRAAAKTQPQ
jgi:AcrR family transcriptional regulator